MAKNLVSNHSKIKDANFAIVKLAMCPSVIDDMKNVYNDKFLTDVELKTKTNSFPAHKIVLCARSPVFKVMMSNDMKEKNCGSIQVDDLEDDTVRQLLLFLYSDNIENLQWENALKLYYSADKYQIEKLRLMCSSFLINNLTISTVSELLLLAHTHSDSDLQKIVEEFIFEHDEEVFDSNEWEKLMETNPHLALKTMHLKYKGKKKQVKLEENSKQNCFLCNKTLPNPQLYKEHLLHVHMQWENWNSGMRGSPDDILTPNLEDKDIPTKKELSDIFFPSKIGHYCHLCKNMTSSYPKYYLHMKNHSMRKYFRCIITSCSRTFLSPLLFQKHTQVHPQDMVNNCIKCGDIFAKQEQLKEHNESCPWRINLSDDDLKCKVCQTKFNHCKYFVQHMETDNHNYKCHKCGLQFLQPGLRRRHIQDEHPDIATTCEFCGQKMLSTKDLFEHLKIHDLYKCKCCSELFPDINWLKFHEWWIHRKLPSSFP